MAHGAAVGGERRHHLSLLTRGTKGDSERASLYKWLAWPTVGFVGFFYGVNGILREVPAWTSVGQTTREVPQLMLKAFEKVGAKAPKALPLGP